MNSDNRKKVEKYMQAVFANPSVKLQAGQGAEAPDEVFLEGEFLGVVYQNEDEGEVSFDFIMSMLEEDLDQ